MFPPLSLASYMSIFWVDVRMFVCAYVCGQNHVSVKVCVCVCVCACVNLVNEN